MLQKEATLTLPGDEHLDPRVRRTRAALVQAFMEAVSTKGFQAVSVQDVAEKAGVNRTTFYLHFPDKVALLDYAIRQAFREEIEKRGLTVCHGSPEALRALVEVTCEFVNQATGHCTRPDPQFNTLVEPQIKTQNREILKMWLEKEGHAAETAMARATAASWAMYGLAQLWGGTRRQSTLSAFVDRVLPLVAGLMGYPPPT